MLSSHRELSSKMHKASLLFPISPYQCTCTNGCKWVYWQITPSNTPAGHRIWLEIYLWGAKEWKRRRGKGNGVTLYGCVIKPWNNSFPMTHHWRGMSEPIMKPYLMAEAKLSQNICYSDLQQLSPFNSLLPLDHIKNSDKRNLLLVVSWVYWWWWW